MHLGLETNIFLGYIFWNLITCSVVRLDKQRARQRGRRIAERTLFILAALFGAAGVLGGMYAYRHKTRHRSFVIGMPLLLIVNACCAYWLLLS